MVFEEAVPRNLDESIICPDGRTSIPNTFCGRGPARRNCDEGQFCYIHQTDAFAVCCSDPTSASRSVRKDPEPKEEEVCINLGRRLGRYTFAVPEEYTTWFLYQGATKGECWNKSKKKKINDQQLRKRAWCLDLGHGDDLTVYAPRAARMWLRRHGAERLRCRNRNSDEIDMTVADDTSTTTVVGHRWVATEIFVEEGMKQPLVDHPITLYFEGTERIYGNTGCNNYRSSLNDVTDTSFQTGGFATTRKYCGGVMDQESAYLGLMTGKIIFYEVIDNGDDVLLLYDVDGDLMARFIGVEVAD